MCTEAAAKCSIEATNARGISVKAQPSARTQPTLPEGLGARSTRCLLEEYVRRRPVVHRSLVAAYNGSPAVADRTDRLRGGRVAKLLARLGHLSLRPWHLYACLKYAVRHLALRPMLIHFRQLPHKASQSLGVCEGCRSSGGANGRPVTQLMPCFTHLLALETLDVLSRHVLTVYCM